MAVKFVRWVLFGVVIALAPLIANYFSLGFAGKNSTIGGVIARGELLLIVSAMCAAAVGELVGSGAAFRTLKVIASGVALVVLVLASLFFAGVAVAHARGGGVDPIAIKEISLYIYGVAIVSCGACVLLSEV